MTRLAFVEAERDLAVLGARHRSTVVVAVTAEAAEALERAGLPYTPVSALADPRALMGAEEDVNRASVEIATEIETYVAERYERARCEGPGFMTANSYLLQYSIGAIAARAHLMGEAIREIDPSSVAVVAGGVDDWFAGEGYAHDPWLELLRAEASAAGFEFEILSGAPNPRSTHSHRRPSMTLALLGKSLRSLRRGAVSLRPPTGGGVPAGLDDARVLVGNADAYDWELVLERLGGSTRARIARLRARALDNRHWTQYFEPCVTFQSRRRLELYALQGGAPRVHEDARRVGPLFDAWLAERDEPPTIELLGRDVFPALVPHLRALATTGPALIRAVDHVVRQALDVARPEAVCMPSISSLAGKRLAFAARERGIPVLAFQHGGAYGTHALVQHEQAEFGHADVFLSYGEGIEAPTNALGVVKATFVPIGSPLLEQARARADVRRPKRLRASVVDVLWIAELTSRNTFAATFIVEDTERYALESRMLARLANARRIRVTYRPFPGQEQISGVAHRLARLHPRVRVAATGSLVPLIQSSDIVVTDTTSGTTWNEVIALGKPLILYCDPDQTPLVDRFAGDLERACVWCRTHADLEEAVERLAREGAAFVQEVAARDTTDFLRLYVLHRDDGRCVDRALSCLAELRAKRGGPGAWGLERPLRQALARGRQK